MKDPRRGFHEDKIAARFDLGYGPESDEELIANITSDLMGRGYVETDMLNHRLGRVALRLTAAGKEEAERLADPVEQRKELRRDFLRAVYEQADGSPTGNVHWTELAPRFGYAEMQMPPKQIEGIADQLAGMGFITIGAEEGAIYRITAKGVDEVEDNTPQDTGTTFQFYGNVQGSVIGTHNTAELTNTYRLPSHRTTHRGGRRRGQGGAKTGAGAGAAAPRTRRVPGPWSVVPVQRRHGEA
jgi:DNA-binding PadR family transcriptional regulator